MSLPRPAWHLVRATRLAASGAAALAVLLAACNDKPVEQRPADGGPLGTLSLTAPDRPPDPKPTLVENPDPQALPAGSTLFVHMNIRYIELPLGAVSNNPAFWAALDQNACGAKGAALLRRNGFRVAVGANDLLPALQALLEPSQPVVEEFSNQVRSGVAVEYVTHDDRRNLSLFYYDAGHQLRGLDVQQVKTVLLAEQWVDREQVNAVRLDVLPVVRTDQVRRQWVRGLSGRYEEQSTYDTLPLGALAFAVRVPYNHFVVIGPSEQVQVPALAGSQFMTRQRGDQRRECLYLLIPQVLRATLDERPAPAPGPADDARTR